MSDAFVVAIKPSARRTNGAVGRLVNRGGVRHGFDDRGAAEEWAGELAADGERLVWIRAANPNDQAAVDAYLVGRSRDPRPRGVDGEWDRDGDRGPRFPDRSSADRTVDADDGGRSQASISRYGTDGQEVETN